MTFILLIIFVLLILGLGYGCLLSFPVSKRQPILPLAFALGGGLITCQLFIIRFWLQWTIDFGFIFLIILEAAILFCWHYRRRQLYLPQLSLPANLSWTESLLFVSLALTSSFSLLRVFTKPLVAFDALSVWSRRIQILYYKQADLFNSGSSFFWISLSKNNYPWHLSLLGWLQTQVTGQFSIALINFLPWCYYLGLIITIYYLAKEHLSRTWSLFLSLIVATMPLIFYHSYNFYADLPLAFYLALLLLVWRRWFVNLQFAELCLASTLAGLALSVKSEAIFFVGPFIVLSFWKLLRSSLLKKGSWSFLFLLLSLPWFAWSLGHDLGISNVASGLGWHPQVTGKILQSFFAAQSWQLWWYFVVIMLCLAWRQLRSSQLFIFNFLWFIYSFCCFLILYYFTETYLYALDDTAFSRNIILFVPLSASLLIDALSVWFKKS